MSRRDPIVRPGVQSACVRLGLIRRLPFFYGWMIVGCAVCSNVARQAAAVATLSVFIVPMTDEFEFMAHYHAERNHQGLGNRLIRVEQPSISSQRSVERRSRLGGMLSFYHHAAA